LSWQQERPMRPQPPMVGLGEASPLHRPQGAAVMAAHRTRRLLKGWSVGRREAIRSCHPQETAIACGLDLRGSSAILHCSMVHLTKSVAAA